MARLIRIIIAVVLLALAFGAGWLYRHFDQHQLSWTQVHVRAADGLMAELGYAGCVPRAAVIAAAEARGWAWRDEAEFAWCHAPNDLRNWLRITVEPPLPFSTDDENARFFGFDAQGCMTEWEYSAC